MSWSYDVCGYPRSLEACQSMIDVLVDLYPGIERRDWSPGTRGLESLEEALISRAFHEDVIDGVEMEFLYEYVLEGRLLA